MTIEQFPTPERKRVLPEEQELVSFICQLCDQEIDPIEIVRRLRARWPDEPKVQIYCLIEIAIHNLWAHSDQFENAANQLATVRNALSAYRAYDYPEADDQPANEGEST